MILAYTERRWNATKRDVLAYAQERTSFWNVLLSERSVFALLCILHAAYFGTGIFTNCRDGRPCSRMEPRLGTRRIFFLLLSRLGDFTRTVDLENNLQEPHFRRSTLTSSWTTLIKRAGSVPPGL